VLIEPGSHAEIAPDRQHGRSGGDKHGHSMIRESHISSASGVLEWNVLVVYHTDFDDLVFHLVASQSHIKIQFYTGVDNSRPDLVLLWFLSVSAQACWPSLAVVEWGRA
jgi:hypothetical protein